MKFSSAILVVFILLLTAIAEPAIAGDDSGVNCKAGFQINNPDGIDDMNDICQEWQDAVSAAQSGGMGGSADPKGGGTTAGPGTGPSSDVGPAGDPNPLAPRPGASPVPRPRVDALPPGAVITPVQAPAGAMPASGAGGNTAATGISWEQFEQSCLAYHEKALAMPVATAESTCTQLAAKYGLSPAGAVTGVTPLVPNVTRRDTVARSRSARYSAGVTSGQTYVLSITGITGAAVLKVYNDAAFKQPTHCLSPNLENSTYRQPADCSFVASTGAVYASVTGTSYLAAAQNSYNIRVSPRFEAAPLNQGTDASPIKIAVNKPYGGTAGSARDDSSYYVVNTTGTSGDVVLSMTGLTGLQDLGLHIFDNARYAGPKLDNKSCFTSEFNTFAESCILPAGRIYYIKVVAGLGGGGPFTLMVDALGASPAAAARASGANQQPATGQNKRNAAATAPPVPAVVKPALSGTSAQ